MQATLASAGALFTVIWLDFPSVYVAPTTVFVLLTANRGASIEKAASRLAGTVIGTLLGVLLAWLYPSIFFFPLIFAITVTAAWFGNGFVFPYAFFMCGITSVIVAVATIDNREQALAIGIQRTLEILIGIGWVFIAGLLFPQPSAAKKYFQQLDRLLDHIRNQLLALFDEEHPLPDEDTESYQATVWQLKELMHNACFESETLRRSQSRHEHLFFRLSQSLMALSTARRHRKRQHTYTLHREIMQSYRQCNDVLFHQLDDLQRLLRGEKPKQTWPPPRPAPTHDPIDDAANAYRRHVHALPDITILSLDETLATWGIFAALHQLYLIFLFALQTFTPDPSLTTIRPLWKLHKAGPSRHFRFRHAMMCGVGVLAMALLYHVWQRTFITAAMVTVVIVLLVTSEESSHKAKLRITGCLLGGIAASTLALLSMAGGSHALMVIWITLCLAVFSYISAGPAKYAYIGMQAALALAMTFDSADLKHIVLSQTLLRVMGISLGVGMVLLLHVLWHVDPWVEWKRSLEKALRCAAAEMRTLLRHTPPVPGSPEETAVNEAIHELAFWQERIIRASPRVDRITVRRETTFRLYAVAYGLWATSTAMRHVRRPVALFDEMEAPFHAMLHEGCALLENMATAVRYPPYRPSLQCNHLSRTREQWARHLQELRVSRTIRNYATHDVVIFLGWNARIDDLIQSLDQLLYAQTLFTVWKKSAAQPTIMGSGRSNS